MKTFRDLLVWQQAHEFVLLIYRATADFPNQELYGLTSQLRRAAVSIPANVVEGFKREGSADFARFLNVSQASLEETKYLLLLAGDLGYLSAPTRDELQAKADEVGKMLHGLIRSIRSKNLH